MPVVACEKVGIDLELGGGFHRVTMFSSNTNNWLFMTLGHNMADRVKDGNHNSKFQNQIASTTKPKFKLIFLTQFSLPCSYFDNSAYTKYIVYIYSFLVHQ